MFCSLIRCGIASLALIGLAGSALASSQAVTASEGETEELSMTWQVTNPFRLFTDKRMTQLHRDVYRSLSEEERTTPILSAERRLAARFRDGWAKDSFGETCWRGDEHRYGGCRKGNPYTRPRYHTVTVSLQGAGEGRAVGACKWSLAPQRKRDRKYRIKAKVISCANSIDVRIPYPSGAKITVRHSDGRRLTQLIKVRDAFIVGIGDSFGSGEGNPDQPVKFADNRDAEYGVAPGAIKLAGYPTRVGGWSAIGDPKFNQQAARWLGQACHRSLYSHQARVALQLAIEDPHRAVTFVHFACAGAEIPQGLFVKHKGNEWVPSPPRVPQISSVAEAQCGRTPAQLSNYPDAYTIQGQLPILRDMFLKRCPRKQARRIDILLVSIGGNDVGFTRLVANAVLADKSTLQRLAGWAGGVFGPREAGAHIKELVTRYKALNRAVHGLLHIPWKQSDRVILTGYPPLAVVDEEGNVCPDGPAGMSVFPEFRLNAKKVRQGEDIASELNRTMARAARRYKWSFVDAHRRTFVGRGLCARGVGDELTQADDPRIPKKVNGQWQPFAPSAYRPYASRTRWFRTPNDAFMTAHYHTSRNIARKILSAKKLRWFQLVLASTYSGAFHPTAEGHAAIADAVLPTARRVLKRYGK